LCRTHEETVDLGYVGDLFLIVATQVGTPTTVAHVSHGVISTGVIAPTITQSNDDPVAPSTSMKHTRNRSHQKTDMHYKMQKTAKT
jgi:hypothetical protein